MKDKKTCLYRRGENTAWDAQFDAAEEFGWIRLGKEVLFWKEGLRWYGVALAQAVHIYRQVEQVYGKLCCGGRSYVIHRLIVILGDGTMLKLHIGDDTAKEAEQLLERLKALHPDIRYGK